MNPIVNNYQMTCLITIKNKPTLFTKVLSPENSLFDSGKITSSIEDDTLLITVEAKTSIGTMKYTIDDILKTAVLVNKIDLIAKN